MNKGILLDETNFINKYYAFNMSSLEIYTVYDGILVRGRRS